MPTRTEPVLPAFPAPAAVPPTADRASAAPVVVADHLAKRFGDREVVSEVSLSLAPGRAFGLLGPNGAGKTTTVRMLTGLLEPTSGAVRLFGERPDRANIDRLRARIGVQTDTNVYESLSVRENLQVWGDLFGVPRRRLPARIDEVLGLLGLDARADSLAGELSKGMRQKVALARAVLHEPDLLVLDEPTAGLDPEAAADLIEYLRELIRTERTTLVLCTHQLHGLETLCDELGVLVGGRLVASGDVPSLLRERWPNRRYRLEVGGDPSTARGIIERAASGAVDVEGDGWLGFDLAGDADVAPLVERLVGAAVPVRALVPASRTVEDLYFATIADHADRPGRPGLTEGAAA
ncbi:ABC transporter ATP-binding protein [Agromyces sp. MMS24-K17]|uniref:ABC transporter ATP-binding protein n=1 Tax=Agromyces sp. MMS24-K17 TaxID=3372850 RepID=UPI0037548915